MPNTYTQIHIQLVFAVKNRAAVITPTWKYDLYSYMTGIIQNHSHKLLAINGMPDHIHILIGMRPTQSLSELMQQLKQESSKWINDKQLTSSRFAWQEGYGAFSYGKSQLPNLIRYIGNQEEHHKKQTFLTEYEQLLVIFGIDYDDRYLFKPLT
ncbi:IS200/IS605 family transposase [Spirosoma utsteinense]|uniref:REP element-mobilizing transposase RayT n=1 Tax=Spirosoma utsteinense TaxID=2585773 RepID=A0ABR6WC24_9BACT|nr:IS200/IS605 family transposase [Spirosoma utsteinense]MBC3788845.1 REP element-mobilizing transposase RayT [Spirosoma utsteinense]MBC3794120.1 REP element-mobilizing transposase RayT [Spirosoma utsteinense]